MKEKGKRLPCGVLKRHMLQIVCSYFSVLATDGSCGISPKKMKKWCEEGFKELGDTGGMGIGRTTHSVFTSS